MLVVLWCKLVREKMARRLVPAHRLATSGLTPGLFENDHAGEESGAPDWGGHPGAVPGQPRRRGRLRLPRRGQHADSPGADAVPATSSAPSCRGTSRAAASRPRAMRAAPAGSASASPPAGPAPPTSSPAWPTPRWTPCRSSPSPARSARRVIGTDAFQETPIVEVCRADHQAPLPGARAPRTSPRVVKEAFHIASTGRPGPVLIDVPKDVQNRAIVPDYDPPMNLPGYRPYRHGHAPSSSSRSWTMIRQSKKPIIYAGGGIIACGRRAGAAGLRRARPASPWR